ncbi:DUF3634 family protein [Vibrio sp. T187]|uniref:DUF3634 family protein n=1 Tax=Vibrio TaxID=662 RepID=UPI0010C9365A|nr:MULTISPECIES: DUF3634 family protein [Vibrio]MBW3697017.1 DUF3634 family protein [Vibrio sp. T187]
MIYVIVAAAIIIFWLVLVDRPVLKVEFEMGNIISIKGHLPPSFKHNLVEIGEIVPFEGTLKVYSKRTGYKLVFSKEVPKNIQQRIRNVFPHQGLKSKGNKKA